MSDAVFMLGFIAGFGFCTVVVSVGYLFIGHYSAMVARKVRESEYEQERQEPTEEGSASRGGEGAA